jgi:hypothetical protein
MNPCCQDPANLSSPVPTDAPSEVMRVCRVCGCRHFEATIDALVVGVREPRQLRTDGTPDD